MKKKLSNKDKKDWQNFLDSKENLQNKDELVFKKSFNAERSIDLHGYSLEEANQEIEKVINDSFSQGLKKITIITGKGLRSKNYDNPYQSENLGILKYSVPNFVKNNSDLMSKISNINFEAVNSSTKGSFEITLKKNKTIIK